jgi:UrcA family protein
MNRFLATFLALLFASLTVSSACLAETDGQATRLVAYADLDLATPQGMRTLHQRIERAANDVCLDVSGPAPAGHVDAACKADALVDARGQAAVAMAEPRKGRSAYLRVAAGNRRQH